MTNKYSFRNSLLNTLISDMSSNATSKFTGIDTGISVVDMTSLKQLEKPMDVKYRIDNIDIANSCRAKNFVYTTVQTNTLVNTSGYTHFTSYIRGGSGGGGGAGGDGERPNGDDVNCDATGGAGGVPGYVALNVNVPLNNNNLYVTVGNSGNGGSRGADDNNPGQNGSVGATGGGGGESSIKLGAGLTLICRANGSFGGNGANGANSGGGNGSNGNAGSSGNGEISTSYTGDTTYNSSYPNISLTGGAGGNQVDTTGGTGFPGSVGYVRIYLKKEL